MILYLKKILVFWICFSLFTQPLLAGDFLKRHTFLDDQDSPLRAYLIPPQDPHEDEIDIHVGSGDEGFSLGLNVSLQETQLDNREKENSSERTQNRPSFSSLSFVFANYETSSDSDDLTLEKSRIKSLEESQRNMLRWTYLSRLVHRCLYFLFLKQPVSEPETDENVVEDSLLDGSSAPLSDTSEVLDSLEEPQAIASEVDSSPILEPSAERQDPVPSRLWLHGRSFPLEGKDLRRVLAINTSLEATEEVLIEGVHTLFLFLMLSQVFYSIKDHTDFGTVFQLIYKNSDENSVRDLYQLGSPIPHAQGLWALLALPFVWGTFKGLKTYYHPEKENLIEAIETLKRFPISFYQDNIRWFFPCSPYEHAFHELTEALLFEKKVLSQEKIEILESINRFSEIHGGRSRMFSYYTFYNVIDGVSSRNFSLLSETVQEEILEEKSLALHFLMRAGHQPYKGFFKFIPAFYARYLLWTLGQCEGLAENITFLGLRGFKTAITVLLFKVIIQGILDILDCPQQQGQTWTGPAAWSTLYTYECFQAYMKTFSNPIPGQPVEMLTGIFSQFHLPSEVSLDLSDKTLNGTSISQILQAFLQAQPSVTIIDLDLSSNNLGETSYEDTMALSNAFQNLRHLRKLNISLNLFGFSNSLNTFAFSKGLRYLTNLYILDLSHNWIGYTNSNGTIALAQALRSLTNLQTLILSWNDIEQTDAQGTVELGITFLDLTNLRRLDLSQNWIGNTSSYGTRALAISLQALINIQVLNLWANSIGNTDSLGIYRLGQSLSYLSNLEVLDLSSNLIGNTDSEGIDALGDTLSNMDGLKNVYLQQNPFYTTSYCQEYISPLRISCPLYFSDTSSLLTYLKSLSTFTTSINLNSA
ncbi:MAG TPA: hypothetical protein PLY23_09155 [Alphaproteobacteria bacterium]|nr:hypothetical protein [Alphaproteobacteria bacterium]HQS94775.1 hypothetical protein [Alphaproteobacteria bacterium]